MVVSNRARPNFTGRYSTSISSTPLLGRRNRISSALNNLFIDPNMLRRRDMVLDEAGLFLEEAGLVMEDGAGLVSVM